MLRDSREMRRFLLLDCWGSLYKEIEHQSTVCQTFQANCLMICRGTLPGAAELGSQGPWPAHFSKVPVLALTFCPRSGNKKPLLCPQERVHVCPERMVQARSLRYLYWPYLTCTRSKCQNPLHQLVSKSVTSPQQICNKSVRDMNDNPVTSWRRQKSTVSVVPYQSTNQSINHLFVSQISLQQLVADLLAVSLTSP